ncbi:chitobiase/beta-hexosaminidase C-terminal domain-containing protein [Paenibacillus sp. N3.4]|uniref:chitobiase/beta-hexosaminidase C-terminal domain-containing protein n=1 Tax=Paenibacillus sp. N3.4 TaxID=2603222 RepID=UPI0011CC7ECB|nr:chitobiase/beta-hexosaminidase C-terminal domain-containing protein [Paenibacillus sp. N3.4]TXK84409.1 hypothetical protein FU659_09310 [Paenibacillus sp. N3.4]
MKRRNRISILKSMLFTIVSSSLIFGSMITGSNVQVAKAAEPANPIAYAKRTTGTMGWHATSYGGGFTEANMKANVDWMAAEYKDFGYEYIQIDGWINTGLRHNENGYITHYKTWANDYKYWADYVHGKGLKYAVYYNPSWILKSIADDETVKVVGTDIKIKDIVNTTDPSKSFQDWYMVDPSKPGAEQYIKGMVNYYKSIGADMLKVDFIRLFDDAYGAAATEDFYRWMREAAGDNFILYYANQKNRNHADAENKYADLIRASEDWRTDTNVQGVWWHTSVRNRGTVQDNKWPPAYNLFDGFVWLSDVSGPGKVALDGDFSILSSTGSTDAEKKFRISLLAMAGSSINIGDRYSNIGNNDVYYKNWEIIDMNKRGFVGKPLARDVKNPLSQVWKGQLPDGTWVVGLFNREDSAQTRSINFNSDLGLSGNYLVSDIWSHSSLGTMSSYSENVQPHSVRLLKISKVSMEPFGAFFTGSQQVTLNAADPQAEIHYTIDGSEPTSSSPVYKAPFTVSQTSTVRAKITQGSGQGYEAAARFIQSDIDPIVNIAAGITSVAAPIKDQKNLILPTVPSGYTIRIKSSDQLNVIKTDGTIIPPSADTTVNLVFEVMRTSDAVTRDTVGNQVIVPAGLTIPETL